MVDTLLVPAIKEAIKQNELGNASPYHLSYACLGSSGASFGVFQCDCHSNNAKARPVLTQALQAAGADPATTARILAALAEACPHGSPLSSSDATLMNGALASAAGRALVDQMDQVLLNIVLAELDTSIAAAAIQSLTIDPVALLYIALWVNMTGAPTTLNRWLAGSVEARLAPPAGPSVSDSDMETYLQANSYFKLHPKNFLHMQASVNAAVPLLPSSA